MIKMIKLTKEQYFILKMAEAKLNLFEAGGVRDWEWYDESLNPKGAPGLDEIEENLKNILWGKRTSK